MASRENQGLHIALILFVMITVGLFVTTYLSWSKATENGELIAQRDTELSDSKKREEAYHIQADLLKFYIGEGILTSEEEAGSQLGRLATLDEGIHQEMVDITDKFKADMLFVSGEGDKNWRIMFGDLIATVGQAQQDLKGLEDTHKSEKQEWQNQLSKAQMDLASAESSKAATEKLLADAQTKFTESERQIRSAFDQKVRDSKTQADQYVSNLSARTEQITTLRTENDEQKKTIIEKSNLIAEYNEESFETPDGKITDVVVSSGLVYINVGTLDNLPRLATFEVYGQDYDAFNKSVKKGSIEVKRIRGSHISEARITSYDLENPILPGDYINSTTWAPGRKLTFGITGSIDINGDKIDDTMRLKSIIERNGGEVVAYINPEGDLVGELTAKTRFLIVGDDPTQIQSNAHATLDLAADAQGVEKMYYFEFLNGMGYRGEAATQGLGVGGGDGGFKPRQPPKRGSSSGAY